MSRRNYDLSNRAEAARETRRRILDTTYRLLLEKGAKSLSMSGLANAAGVSPQTIYNSIGGKAEVIKACYDITIAGDDIDAPLSERPAFRSIWETTESQEFFRRYSTWVSTLSNRVAPLLAALVRPGQSDPGIAAFVETIEAERRIGSTNAMKHYRERFGLPEGLTLEQAVDITWTLNSPDVYDRLVGRCGWSPEEYESWLTQQLAAALQ
ncbi:TetR/AcrR family transcriptional regulator [Glutamicibacter sp.]|uniref:TetR/AcrR family transcriptional regulator n=1 Tax=Glutamicibacter sp. TaxID=1931995 RepID=UPI0028BDF0D1|nr:TetR/AcrR family transcriptional regulator [Glutamicibacter sp.]